MKNSQKQTKISNQNLIKIFLQTDFSVARDADNLISSIEKLRQLCNILVEDFGIKTCKGTAQNSQFTEMGVDESQNWQEVVDSHEADVLFEKASDKTVEELFCELEEYKNQD